ncbi:hypothetical protein BV25DRAFT_356278 [Artomyces pyxidatus]|uniref:Uncharacterized protein n=1 Tax=Artomyces pyxidatus TaxID=48021 RepID=A0ACB8T6L8_9AGAM|nr:hypothetical protein BV25DRAFT_356278 [Artomyces pyxidatus]
MLCGPPHPRRPGRSLARYTALSVVSLLLDHPQALVIPGSSSNARTCPSGGVRGTPLRLSPMQRRRENMYLLHGKADAFVVRTLYVAFVVAAPRPTLCFQSHKSELHRGWRTTNVYLYSRDYSAVPRQSLKNLPFQSIFE